MFSILITADKTAWETDQLMRMARDRFKEYSGAESAMISADNPVTLKSLEECPALLMYEKWVEGSDAESVRYGHLRDIIPMRGELVFRFMEEGRFTRSVIDEYATRLGLAALELSRTHWAIKDGGIPTTMRDKLQRSYDVVFSFAGEDREYVEQAASCLRGKGIRVFYDQYEEANLWGRDLAEHFDLVYRQSSRYCVLFISENYVRKPWTIHERRMAVARALLEPGVYILPARFDATEIPGLAPTIASVSLSGKTPSEFALLLLAKLG